MEPKEQFENAVKWIDALKSGEYRKTTRQLGKEDSTGNWSYCCLGVGCKVLGLPVNMAIGVSFEFKDQVGLNTVNGEFLLSDEIEFNGNFMVAKGRYTLTQLNDDNFPNDKGFENMVIYIMGNIDTLFNHKTAQLLKEHYKKN